MASRYSSYDPAEHWPQMWKVRGYPPVTARPAMPDLNAGHCVTGAAGLGIAAWQAERGEAAELAAVACSWCPVLDACRTWALAAGHGDIGGTAGGLTAEQRRLARRRRKRAHTKDMAGIIEKSAAATAVDGITSGPGDAAAHLAAIEAAGRAQDQRRRQLQRDADERDRRSAADRPV